MRDYIHVVDLANGHVKALKKIEENAGLCIYNLGTGHGYSVLDIVKNFEEANGIKIPSLAVLAILQPVTVTRARQNVNLAGKHSTELRKCVRIPGDGRRTIQTVMRINEKRGKSLIFGFV